MHRIWVTGYHSYELNVFDSKDPKVTIIKYALKNYFKNRLDAGQLDWVITGANLGVEQWAAEVAITLRKKYSLRVAMMTPYEQFAERWNEAHQTIFLNLKHKVDFFASTSNTPYQSPVQLRNYQSFMVRHTDRALMIYDEEHPAKPKYDYSLIKRYQEHHHYPLDLLDFYDLQDEAEEYRINHTPDRFIG